MKSTDQMTIDQITKIVEGELADKTKAAEERIAEAELKWSRLAAVKALIVSSLQDAGHAQTAGFVAQVIDRGYVWP